MSGTSCACKPFSLGYVCWESERSGAGAQEAPHRSVGAFSETEGSLCVSVIVLARILRSRAPGNAGGFRRMQRYHEPRGGLGNARVIDDAGSSAREKVAVTKASTATSTASASGRTSTTLGPSEVIPPEPPGPPPEPFEPPCSFEPPPPLLPLLPPSPEESPAGVPPLVPAADNFVRVRRESGQDQHLQEAALSSSPELSRRRSRDGHASALRPRAERLRHGSRPRSSSTGTPGERLAAPARDRCNL
jgi:hypothetical protein